MSDLPRRSGLHIVAGTIPVMDDGDDRVFNESFLFSPSGGCGVQGKLHMMRFEKEEWLVSPRDVLRIFEADLGRIAIARRSRALRSRPRGPGDPRRPPAANALTFRDGTALRPRTHAGTRAGP
ncbi:MAG: hypothetical protein HY704_05120 [Gemmatimonadetes bacterium]|nr:hypothetical protein [Gemmatimonadota bacterium]